MQFVSNESDAQRQEILDPSHGSRLRNHSSGFRTISPRRAIAASKFDFRAPGHASDPSIPIRSTSHWIDAPWPILLGGQLRGTLLGTWVRDRLELASARFVSPLLTFRCSAQWSLGWHNPLQWFVNPSVACQSKLWNVFGAPGEHDARQFFSHLPFTFERSKSSIRIRPSGGRELATSRCGHWSRTQSRDHCQDPY